MSNQHFDKVREWLVWMAEHARTERFRRECLRYLDEMDQGIRLNEQQMETLLAAGLRGSEFPGDQVGRWDD